MSIEKYKPEWEREWEERERRLNAPHWADAFMSEFTVRAFRVLKLSEATGPEDVVARGYAYWSRVLNCGANTIKEFEHVFNNDMPFPRSKREESRPFRRASTDALLRELAARGFTIERRIIEKG